MLNLTPPLDQLLQQALQHHQSNRLPQAESLYRQILTQQPHHPEALRLLGLLAYQCNQPDTAIQLLRQALAQKPNFPLALLDLGNALQQKSQLPEAIDAFNRAIALQPNFTAAYINLGSALHAANKFHEARTACERALELNPHAPEAHNNLANALNALNQPTPAIAAYQKALALNPNYPTAWFNLANALHAANRTEEALAAFNRAIALNPNFAPAQFNLADLLQSAGQHDPAIAAYSRAIALNPNLALAYNGLANSLKYRGRIPEAIEAYKKFLALDPNNPLGHNNLGAAHAEIHQSQQAIDCYQRALELDPNYMAAHANLGSVLKDQGKLDEAIASFRRALTLAPDSALVHSKLAYTLNFHPDYAARQIFEEADRFNTRHAEPLQSEIRPHTNNRDPISPTRRLKIAYVSPDFWAQSESYFVTPLLAAHSHEDFEIHCYASVLNPDHITAKQKSSVDHWHDVLGKSDADLAEIIRNDQIDILIDLTMHMASNRLLLFARKPAPIQITWLAYPGTTGLKSIDYRITDSYMDPENPSPSDLPIYSEKPLRLPDGWICYDPLIQTPQAAPRPPHNPTSPLTFGSLNNPCKMNPALLQTWAQLLQSLPNSQLLLLTGNAGQRQDILHLFTTLNINPTRIEFTSYLPRPEYLRLYDRIDIVLDPLPYNGITTTLNALWMSVPVITQSGQTAAGRAGKAMLSLINHPELIATTPTEFLQIATTLATNPTRLAHLRSTLRNETLNSPLMNPTRYAHNLESAYRQLWQTWRTQNP